MMAQLTLQQHALKIKRFSCEKQLKHVKERLQSLVEQIENAKLRDGEAASQLSRELRVWNAQAKREQRFREDLNVMLIDALHDRPKQRALRQYDDEAMGKAVVTFLEDQVRALKQRLGEAAMQHSNLLQRESQRQQITRRLKAKLNQGQHQREYEATLVGYEEQMLQLKQEQAFLLHNQQQLLRMHTKITLAYHGFISGEALLQLARHVGIVL